MIQGSFTADINELRACYSFVSFVGFCRRYCKFLFAILTLSLSTTKSFALVLSKDLEAILVKNVSTSWQTVSLTNTYTSAVVVCTYNLKAFGAANPPAVTRMRNITASSFDLRIQGWEDSAATASNVHCLIADEGAHTLSDGLKFEAHTVVSDQTNGQFSTDGGWNLALQEDVSASVINNYADPVVLGQVMSFNDNRASTIFVTDCDNRTLEPFNAGMADGICVGKHIGMIPSTRDPETIGYIIAEEGSGTVNNVFYELAMGNDTISGSPNPKYYTTANDHNIAVLTQAAEDGGNGSWAVLMNSDPLSPTQMALTVDEEIFAGDVSRRHTAERVYYWAFAGADVTLQKKVINDSGGSAVSGDFTLTATGPDTISGVTGDISVTDQPVHPGVYVLTENNLPGYTASAWTCTGTTISGSTIKLAGGDDVVCTIVNEDADTALLTLTKVVKNTHGGTAVDSDFTLTFDDGTGTTGSGATGTAAVTSVTVPAGTYSLSETALSGYQLVQIRCDGSDSDGSDGLVLAAAEDVTCEFGNTDLGIDLEMKKTVNDTTPNIGDVLTFTLTVTNNGPDPATNLSVSDMVPAGFSYVATSMAGGTSTNDSSPAGTGLLWTLASLGVGSSVNLTFQATVVAP